VSHSQSNCVIASSVIGRRFFLNKKNVYVTCDLCLQYFRKIFLLGDCFVWYIHKVLQLEQKEEIYRKKFIYTHVYLSWYSHLHNYLPSSYFSYSLFALLSSFLYIFCVVVVYVIYEKGRRRRQRQTKDIRGVWRRHKEKDLRRTFYYIEYVYMQAEHVSYSFYCSWKCCLYRTRLFLLSLLEILCAICMENLSNWMIPWVYVDENFLVYFSSMEEVSGNKEDFCSF